MHQAAIIKHNKTSDLSAPCLKFMSVKIDVLIDVLQRSLFSKVT